MPASEVAPLFVWPLSRNKNMIFFDSPLYSPPEVEKETELTTLSVSPDSEDSGDDSETSYAKRMDIPCQKDENNAITCTNYMKVTYPDGIISQLMYTSYNKDAAIRRLQDSEHKII